MNPDSDLHSVSISSTLFNQIFHGEGDAREESGGASEKKNEDEVSYIHQIQGGKTSNHGLGILERQCIQFGMLLADRS